MNETDLQAQEPAIADETLVVEETEGDAAPAPAVTDADEASTGKPPVQKRIDELTRLRREAERERDYWHSQATRPTPAQPDAEPEAPKPPPKLSDFDYDEGKYATALAAHVKAETAREVREELRKERLAETERERAETFGKREKDFAKKHEDYQELTRDPSLPITKTMAKLVADGENGPEVLYYLANNREEARQISQMDETSAARAIGRIESKLEAKAATPAPAPKPVSKAPPPPPQIETGESAVRISTTSPDSDKLSDDEWVKAENRRLARKKVKANA